MFKSIGPALALSISFVQFLGLVMRGPHFGENNRPHEWELAGRISSALDLNLLRTADSLVDLDVFLYVSIVAVGIPLTICTLALLFLLPIGTFLWWCLLIFSVACIQFGMTRLLYDVVIMHLGLSPTPANVLFLIGGVIGLILCFIIWRLRHKLNKHLRVLNDNKGKVSTQKKLYAEEVDRSQVGKTVYIMIFTLAAGLLLLIGLPELVDVPLGIRLGISIPLLVIAMFALVWLIIGWTGAKGRGLQWSVLKFFESQWMRLALTVSSLAYIPIGAAVLSVFDCGTVTCPTGTRFVGDGTPTGLSPTFTNAISMYQTAASVPEYCYPCGLAVNSTSSVCEAAACVATGRNRLLSDPTVSCDAGGELHRYWWPAAIFISIQFLIGVPILFFFLIRRVTQEVLRDFPVEGESSNQLNEPNRYMSRMPSFSVPYPEIETHRSNRTEVIITPQPDTHRGSLPVPANQSPASPPSVSKRPLPPVQHTVKRLTPQTSPIPAPDSTEHINHSPFAEELTATSDGEGPDTTRVLPTSSPAPESPEDPATNKQPSNPHTHQSDSPSAESPRPTMLSGEVTARSQATVTAEDFDFQQLAANHRGTTAADQRLQRHLWSRKALTSSNAAFFLYDAYVYRARFSRLFELLQKLFVLLTVEFIFARRSQVAAMSCSVAAHFVGLCWCVARPFTFTFLNVCCISYEVMLVITSILALLDESDIYVPGGVFLTVVIINIILVAGFIMYACFKEIYYLCQKRKHRNKTKTEAEAAAAASDRRKSSVWGALKMQTKQLEEFQKYVDIGINRHIRYIVIRFFIVSGVFACCATQLGIIGLVERDAFQSNSAQTVTTDTTSQNLSIHRVFLGASGDVMYHNQTSGILQLTWESFGPQCCCHVDILDGTGQLLPQSSITDLEAFLSSNITNLTVAERWTCNGNLDVMVERRRAQNSLSGLDVRGLCSPTFSPSCSIINNNGGSNVIDNIDLATLFTNQSSIDAAQSSGVGVSCGSISDTRVTDYLW